MKTAISLPDPVFDAAEKLAAELHMSRSQLYATAIPEFVAERRERLLSRVEAGPALALGL